MNKKIVDKIFPGYSEAVKDNVCPICKKRIGKFRDSFSEEEYKISGLCQDCQDEFFNGD